MYPMATSRVIDSKEPRMAISLGYFSDKKSKMVNVMEDGFVLV